MKKLFISILSFMFLFIGANNAFASSPWNGASNDCPTVAIANVNTNVGFAWPCWPNSSVSATYGDKINVRVYYHNTSSATATNARVVLTQSTTGPANSYSISGVLKSNQGDLPFGPVVVYSSGAQGLSFGSVKWHPNQTGDPATPLPNGQTGAEIMTSTGVSIGDIAPGWSTQGSLVISFNLAPYTPPANCTINSFSASPSTITTVGGSSTLSWSTTNCNSVSINQGVGGVPSSGATSVSPTVNTQYTITASGPNGSAFPLYTNVNVNIASNPCTINSFNASPNTITSGASSTLSWSTTNCNSVNINQGVGSVTSPSGSVSVYPTTNTQYTMTASGPGGVASPMYATVNVNSVVSGCVINTFNANPNTITSGASSTLSWTSSNCTSVNISPSVGTFSPNSSATVYPTSYTLYTIVGYGANGTSVPLSASVNVSNINPTCSISYFTANPSGSVSAGSAVTLSWSTTGSCGQLVVNGVPVYGSFYTVYPSVGTTYVLTTATGQSSSVYVPVNAVNNTLPSATTNSARDVDEDSARLSGYVSGNGSTINGWLEFPCFGAQYGNVYGVSSSSLSSTVYSLNPDTRYSYCAVAQNPSTGVIVRANQESFRTLDDGNNFNNNAPSISTHTATNVTQNSANLNGYVASNGNGNTTTWFRYGTTSGYFGMTTNTVSQGTGSRNISEYIYNLSPNTTYYFQAVARNSYGTVYGSTQQFTTSNSFYNNTNTSVMTTVATNVQQTSASINGLLLNTSTNNTSVYFEYGTTVNLGGTTNQKYLGSGNSVPFSETLTGLSPNTIYFYRAVGTNGSGIFRGVIEVFQTAKVPVTNTRTVYVNTGPTRTGLESPIMLKIENRYEVINLGDTVDYTVTYSNIGGDKLTHALIQVILPKYVTYVNASRGTFDPENSTLSVPLEDLTPGAGGVMYVQGRVNSLPEDHASIITTALLIYTTPSNAQENAIAYVINRDNGMNNLGASAGLLNFWGLGLLGWLLLLILLLLIILVARTYRQKYSYSEPRYYPPYVPRPANDHPMTNSDNHQSTPHT
jgi:hypothetical protein